MKTLVVCKDNPELFENEFCNLVEKELPIVCSWKNTLNSEHMKDVKQVIAIGGDGTILSASHFIKDKPILAVNSQPENSVGALTTINLENLNEKIQQIKENKHQEEKLERIQAFINDKPLDCLALNEIFLANEKAYHISKYKIKYQNKEEEQLSSGLIFSTGTGSTAWFKSAGGTPFSPQEKFIKMITREPYIHNKKSNEYNLTNLSINENEEIEITALTDSILVLDSIREHKIKANDKIKIKISEFPLRRII
jgi:NAD kinase